MRTVSVGLVIVSLGAVRETLEDGRVSCFTPREQDYSMGFRNSMLPLAARLCAKRAFQLWNSAEERLTLRLDEVEVLHAPFGSPRVVLRGDALRVAAARGVTTMHLSLSHSQSYAGALLAVMTDRDRELGCGESS